MKYRELIPYDFATGWAIGYEELDDLLRTTRVIYIDKEDTVRISNHNPINGSHSDLDFKIGMDISKEKFETLWLLYSDK